MRSSSSEHLKEVIMMINREEKELLEEIERDEWKPVKNLNEEKEKLLRAVKERNKKKVISIRVSEGDIRKLKKKALETGIPYQTLISFLIRQFVEGKVKIEI
jgi:predicted DNA binding CopG/RHH family protein